MNNRNKPIEIADVEHAYLLLKREIYYERVDLFTREELAEFDTKLDKQEDFKNIRDFVNSQDIRSEYFEELAQSIDCKFLPKKFSWPNKVDEAKDKNEDQNIHSNSEEEKKKEENGKEINYISNLRTADYYQIEEINYFFSGKIPLFIISMLWVINVGQLIDDALQTSCYGNRLEKSDGNGKRFRAFKYYLNQYNNWRNGAIDSGLNSLKDGHDVLLVAIDFKQCFYHLPINWDEVEKLINNNKKCANKELCCFLTDIIAKIHDIYFEKSKPFLIKTHRTITGNSPVAGIPIGLPSSRILANWELHYFDEEVQKTVRPIYYGRYVDDVLIVIHDPNKTIVNKGPESILEEYLEKSGILGKFDSKRKGYSVEVKVGCDKKYFQHLYVSDDKLIIHFYDKDHSWAGLKEFKEELRQKASEFRFLPEEDQYKDLVDEAYDIQYKGSINKFRSVIGITENGTKLSNYLFKQSLKVILCKEGLRNQVIDELFRFYRGKNIFDYCRLWERVFSILVISGHHHEIIKFYKDLDEVIEKIEDQKGDFSNEIIGKIKKDCHTYKKISLCMSIGLMSVKIYKKDVGVRFLNFLYKNKIILGKPKTSETMVANLEKTLAWKLRESNLLRHQHLCWPLLDYTNYRGDLCKFDIDELMEQFAILELKQVHVDNSARFIHLDEFLLFKYLLQILAVKLKILEKKNEKINFGFPFKKTDGKDENGFVPENIKYIYGKYISDKCPELYYEKDPNQSISPTIDCFKINSDEERENNGKIRLGIVSLKVKDKDIKAAFTPGLKPNLCYERQNGLFELLNIATKKPPCDLLIFPEVSIPFNWLPFMVNHARRSNIGLVFGLEHLVVKPFAFNFIVTVLPFSDSNKYKSTFLSLRLKNHYSPNEERLLGNLRLKQPEITHKYELFSWRNTVFSVLNCFELTNILHRGLFRSRVDLLIASEYNPDINYFSNIIESITRDIHCYSAQSNSSVFGDSRIIAPMKTEKMNILRIKGGENAVVLKAEIDINDLRDFQQKEYDPEDERFKPTPAGFEHAKVNERRQ